MIGFFPNPYPDELLYSVCARYCEWSPYLTNYSAAGDLLPEIHEKLDAEFLGTLSNEAYNAFTRHDSPVNLVMHHTMFPYRARFLPLQRRRMVLKSALVRKSELTRSMIKAKTRYYFFEGDKPLYLRFCPICAEEDRKIYGETYLHRSHHLFGVDICPIHKCYLIDSMVRRDAKRTTIIASAESFVRADTKPIMCTNPVEMAVADYIAAIFHEEVDMTSDISAGLFLDTRLRGTKYQKADRGMRRNNILLLQELSEYYRKFPLFRLRSIKKVQMLFCRTAGHMPLEVCLLGKFLGISPAEICAMKLPEKTYAELFDEQVLNLYEQGMPCTQISAKMHVSEKSVRFAVRTAKRLPSLPSDKRKAWNKLDWNAIDEDLLPRVEAELQRILNDKEHRPIKISVDAIIGLPAKMFHGAKLPVIVMVLKKKRNGNSDNILFIDASKYFTPEKAANVITDEDIERIYDAYVNRSEIEGFSHVAYMDEIERNGFNCNIPRYVNNLEKEADVDLTEQFSLIKGLDARAATIDNQLKEYFEELGLEV